MADIQIATEISEWDEKTTLLEKAHDNGDGTYSRTVYDLAAGGGGGGGGAVTVADGADTALGTTTDAANANSVIGQLKQIKTNTATPVGVTDEAAWTAGTSPFSPSGGVFNDTAAALTTGEQGTERTTPNRARHVNLRNQAGAELGTTANPLQTGLAQGGNVATVNSDGSLTVRQGNLIATSAGVVVDSVTAQQSAAIIPAATTMQNAVSASGAGTVLTTTGYSTAILTVTGTWVGSIAVTGTSGGTAVALPVTSVSLGQPLASITADGTYVVDCQGFDSITATVTWSSGSSVTVTGEVSPLAYPARFMHTDALRSAAVVHRSAITAVDKITNPAQMTAGADVTAGGSLVQSGTFTLSYAFGNKYGSTTASPVAATISTAGSGGSIHCVKATGAVAAGGTPEWVDIYNSPASANLVPQWVGRCTYTQFINANGVIVTAVGTVSAGSSLGSYVIQVNVLGTGLAYNVVPVLYNNAYIPDTITAVNCTGFKRAHVKCVLVVTDLRSLPSLVVVPYLKNTDGYYDQCQPMGLNLLSSTGQSLRQDFSMDVDGSSGLVICCDTIAGQGAAWTCSVELE